MSAVPLPINIEDGSSTIELTRLRDLDLMPGSAGAGFLAAASGLVRTGSALYVVADDELHLGCFEADGSRPGRLLRLFPGELPTEARQRKKVKPDLELLVALPADATAPYGSLLALGSGSGPQRRRGALLQLNEAHEPLAPPRVLDASAFFDGLAEHVEDLNIEGAWVVGKTLHCLQRGHRAKLANLVIQLDLDAVLRSLTDGVSCPAPRALHAMLLGECHGVPLSFSDACGLPDGRWVFTAVAEDTESSYEDGRFVGAAIGMADAALRPIWIRPVSPAVKIEGVDARAGADTLDLLLVTDADDPSTPGGLFAAQVA